MDPRGGREDRLGGREDTRTIRIDRIERPRRRQRFKLPLVEQARVDATGKLVQRVERPILVALGNELLHRALAHALQRGKRIAYCQAVLGALDREFSLAAVDVRRQAGDAHAPHVISEDAKLVSQRHVETHRGGVEFLGIMRLQPRRLIGEQGVSGGVRLVEAVSGELVDQVEQLVGLAGRDLVDRKAALDEPGALRVHLSLDLLAHRAAQKVGLAQAVASQDLRRLHHLFLIDEDPVGFGQYPCEQGMRIGDLLAPVLARAEARDIVHRAGAVERDERDDVAEIRRAHRCQRASHALRFELEHADRVALLEQLVDALIIPFERIEIDDDVAVREQVDRLLEH